ncbi:MAG: coenzyme F420-0:L-glutamate ligase [Rhodobacteraceae bacterium]|nr:coenzyme F420-0:L-glutamate ligase [Paracoccaceae bacterium]
MGLELLPVPGIPDINPGDDIVAIIGDALAPLGLVDGDILTSAHKIFSKAEGQVVALASVTPSQEALEYGEKLNKDPRKVEVILRESARVVKTFRHPGQNEGVMICQHRLGFISANAAVDESNTGADETVILLPKDPDASARRLRDGLEARFGVRLGVVITDTFGRPWRLGQVNVAIGLAGVPATVHEGGQNDAYGRELAVTEPAFADEIATASGLVVGKAAQTPVVRFRGLTWVTSNDKAADILRPSKENVF